MFNWKAGLVSLAACAVAGGEIVINEIHYNSSPNDARDEFVELYNSGDSTEDLGGWFFQEGIDFVIPAGTELEAGAYLVIAEDPVAMLEQNGVVALGPYDGRLSGDGETIELRRASGSVADEVTYQNNFPWPTGAGGTGASMELIDPELDNDLGGSWRSSTVTGLPEAVLIEESAAGWSWRAGTSEASDPLLAWTGKDFSQDGTWSTGSLPIGYGGVGALDFGVGVRLTGMRNDHTSAFLRRMFEIAPGEIPGKLRLRYLADDGVVVFINGREVHRSENMPAGQLTIADEADSNVSSEDDWLEFELPGAGTYLQEGQNVIAVHAFNASVTSSDFGVDLSLIRPGPEPDAKPLPSPGVRNSQYSETAAPAIRQVDHSPNTPTSDETVVITAKVTDPDGVGSVILQEVAIAPGDYVPAFLAKPHNQLLSRPNDPREANPAYETGWTDHTMLDNGVGVDEVANDGIYSVALAARPNRTLIRYRITVADTQGASVRVPYEDDDQLNFAYFHYNGVPDYVEDGDTYSAEKITAIPVYHILTTDANFSQAVAYSGSQIPRDNYDARSEYNWSCTFINDGKVHDNARYRLRQRNARYSGNGKRSFKFRFNRGNYPVFRGRDGDKYPEPWKYLATHKMIGSRGNPTWGIEQATNNLIWNTTGTPASFTHWGHFRFIRNAEEAETPYNGDYYGMLLALEEFDSRFLDSHGMEKGNLYKLISGRTNGLDVQRYQAANSVNDGSDFSNIIRNVRPDKSDEWLNEHVNWERWNHYKAVVDMIRHYDVQPNLAEHLKNRAFYFEPSETNPLGRLWTLPWDSDTSWGPNWNGGVDFPTQAIGANGNNPRDPFITNYLNTVREMRDLIWTPDQIDLYIDPLADLIDEIVPIDRARWIGAVGGSQNDPPLDRVTNDMKKFAFDGGSWTGGTNNIMPSISRDSGISGQQGRDAYLDALTNVAGLPTRPIITYSGPAGFPLDQLAFTSSAFEDPQGAGSFAAMEWRIAEVTPLGGGSREIMPAGRVWTYLDDGTDPGPDWKLPVFNDAAWKSGAAPLAYGTINGLVGELATQTDLENGVDTVYFRTTVNVTDLAGIDRFTFRMLVDDGAVVWVNGQEAFREGFAQGTVVAHETFAEENGDEDDFDEFEVSASLFVEGENVIAIEVHNRSERSNDLGFEILLDATEVLLPPGATPSFEWNADWESGELTSFSPTISTPPVTKLGRTYRARVRHRDNTGIWSNWSLPVEFTPGEPTIQPFIDSLVISKVMYHPLPPSEAELAVDPTLEEGDFEWIEIMNIGSEALDLTDVRFTKGIEFDFVDGSAGSIMPGQRLVIVSNEDAFNLRHGFNETPDFVIGEFAKSLSNGGELLKLSFGAGLAIREVEYLDKLPWPEPADGSGASLVLIDSDGSSAANWRPSVGMNGSPGADDGLPYPGDLEGYALLSDLEASVSVVVPNAIDLTFEQRVNADAARILLESSDDLVTWAPLEAEKVAESFPEIDRSIPTYRIPNVAENRARFFRLRVQLR